MLLILDVLSLIRIPKFFIPDPTVHKKRDEKKSNLAPYGFRSKSYWKKLKNKDS
jgi:hypothetical protein